MKTIRILALLLLITVPAGLQAVEHRESFQESFAAGAELALAFENLAGEITLIPGGDAFVVEGEVIARARNAEEAAALAQSVTLQQSNRAGGHELWMEFPVEKHGTFIYGARGNNTSTSYRGERVNVRGHGRGAEVHARVTVRVPAGMTVTIDNLVGTITAQGLAGDITLQTGSGRIESGQGRGRLAVHSGSGEIEVKGHDGALEARAGSGDIAAAGVNGDVHARTGSGDIELQDVHGEILRLRTGSGGIRIEGATGNLNARTGSGGMRISGLVAGAELETSAGSGTTRLEGDLGAVTSLDMGAGSGSIRVESSTMPNLALRARAGSGRVTVEGPGVQVDQSRRNRAQATLGDGSGKGRISTGSGSVSFRVEE